MLRTEVEDVISEAMEEFRQNRDLRRALDVITTAVGKDQVQFGEFEDAERTLKERIDQMLIDEDGIEPDEWARTSRDSLLEKIGVTTEHTEVDIEVGVQSGAIETLAEETSP